MLLGYLSLAASTVLLHLGPSIGLLVLGRILQGFSSGAVSSVGFAILYDAFDDDEVGSAMGWAAAALDAGGFIGPAIAGILFQAGGERAVFIFAYTFIAFDICLGLAVVIPSGKKADPPVQGSREDEYIASTASLMEKSSKEDGGTQQGEATVVPTGRKTSFWRLMLHPRLLVAFSGWLVIGIFETAFDSVLPLFVEKTYDWSVLGAGLIFIAFYLPGIITSPICGYLMDRVRHASRILGAGGFLVLTGPSFLLLGLTEGPDVGKQALLCVLLTLIGIGTGFSGPPLLKEVGVVVEKAEQAAPGAYGAKGATARAYGVHNAAFAAGNLLGPVMAGAIKASVSWTAMGWVFGILGLVAGAAVACSLQGWVGKIGWQSRLRRSVPETV